MRLSLIVVAVIVVAFALYVRFAPTDASQWHVAVKSKENKNLVNGAQRIASGVTLEAFHEIALSTPRTQVLAGSLDEGMVTYVSRSALWSFPDYTTVQRTADGVAIYGRLRFGRSDLGVNAARIDGWLEALRQR